MNPNLESIRQAVKSLTYHEKAALAHTLLRDIDGCDDNADEVERAWTEVAEERLDSYLKGEIGTIDGNEAMLNVRNSIK